MDFDDLEVLKTAEGLADSLWRDISNWDSFAKDTVGRQLARSADSVGANIAEAFGRYHFGDRLKFFYYSRGSIFETKFWLNRAISRKLISQERANQLLRELTELAKRLNSLVDVTKKQQAKRKMSEDPTSYIVQSKSLELFSPEELSYLRQPTGVAK